MSKILIIGAGVMGSAFTFPCIDNGHKVTVLGSPLENDRIDELSKTLEVTVTYTAKMQRLYD